MSHKFDIGVFATIVNERNEILHILRNDMDLWETPGGGLEESETPKQAVVREVKEETGFDIEVIRLSGIYIRPHNNGVIFNFFAKVIGGEEKPHPDEVREIAWFKIDDLPKETVAHKNERIQDALDVHDVVFKIQNGPSVRELIK